MLRTDFRFNIAVEIALSKRCPMALRCLICGCTELILINSNAMIPQCGNAYLEADLYKCTNTRCLATREVPKGTGHKVKSPILAKHST